MKGVSPRVTATALLKEHACSAKEKPEEKVRGVAFFCWGLRFTFFCGIYAPDASAIVLAHEALQKPEQVLGQRL